ncbi:TMEM175 family protein [Arcanobacterium phocae]|uniref:TMEM175 family protein n=1 Tax=Arcanobacterium phocae TaxID=131112 RepID=UPI001C0E941D|nr:TMEM175 family protein [Arcanobacterium phocae]
MEAFSDGVLAIVITIMVLKLNLPEQAQWHNLYCIIPTLMAYILSYIYVGIYWANHHHLIGVTKTISGSTLWKNLHWLFWITLIPAVTEWVGIHPFASIPTLLYGIVLFMCSVTYHFLQRDITACLSHDYSEFSGLDRDLKGKISIIAYLVAVPGSLFFPIISYFIYTAIALTWFIPDTRLEKLFRAS